MPCLVSDAGRGTRPFLKEVAHIVRVPARGASSRACHWLMLVESWILRV